MNKHTLLPVRRNLKASPIARSPFRIGQFVMVTADYSRANPNFNYRGGWIKDIKISDNEDKLLFCVEWDAETLRSLPMAEIQTCEQEGNMWEEFVVEDAKYLTSAAERSSRSERKATITQMTDAYTQWHTDQINDHVTQVIGEHRGKDFAIVFGMWAKVFATKLRFPFEAEYKRIWYIYEELAKSDIFYPTKIKVTKLIDKLHPTRGVMVAIVSENHHLELPICEVDAYESPKNKNKKLIDLYSEWYQDQNIYENLKN